MHIATKIYVTELATTCLTAVDTSEKFSRGPNTHKEPLTCCCGAKQQEMSVIQKCEANTCQNT